MRTWLAVIAVVLAIALAYHLAGNPTGGDNGCAFAANNGDPLPASCAP